MVRRRVRSGVGPLELWLRWMVGWCSGAARGHTQAPRKP